MRSRTRQFCPGNFCLVISAEAAVVTRLSVISTEAAVVTRLSVISTEAAARPRSGEISW